MKKLTSWDYDGVLSTGNFSIDSKNDIIITGRCRDESHIIYAKLRELCIEPPAIYFNPMTLEIRGNYSEEAREKSGYHKVKMLETFSELYEVTHYEDDPIQIELIKLYIPSVKIIQVPNPTGNFYAK